MVVSASAAKFAAQPSGGSCNWDAAATFARSVNKNRVSRLQKRAFCCAHYLTRSDERRLEEFTAKEQHEGTKGTEFHEARSSELYRGKEHKCSPTICMALLCETLCSSLGDG